MRFFTASDVPHGCPQAKLALALAVELARLEREFGLTPAARARLDLAAPARAKRTRTAPWGEWAWIAGLNGRLRRGAKGGPR